MAAINIYKPELDGCARSKSCIFSDVTCGIFKRDRLGGVEGEHWLSKAKLRTTKRQGHRVDGG